MDKYKELITEVAAWFGSTFQWLAEECVRHYWATALGEIVAWVAAVVVVSIGWTKLPKGDVIGSHGEPTLKCLMLIGLSTVSVILFIMMTAGGPSVIADLVAPTGGFAREWIR